MVCQILHFAVLYRERWDERNQTIIRVEKKQQNNLLFKEYIIQRTIYFDVIIIIKN